MKALIKTFILLLFICSCTTQSLTNHVVVTGQIDGLKKGTLFLQKIQDTSLITVDSVVIDGLSNFELSTPIQEPQIMYVYLDKNDGIQYNDRIAFFAEDTVYHITSTIHQFEEKAIVKGGSIQHSFNQFNTTLNQLQQTETAIFKKQLAINQQRQNATISQVDSLQKAAALYMHKKTAYVLNYALQHRDKEIAPYVLITQGQTAQPKLLDSIFNLFPKNIQTSLYGKQLQEAIDHK